jgi:hypothetical protein
MMRLLRPTRSGIFWRSFRFHSAHYARETIAKICSLGVIALRSPCSAQARGNHCAAQSLLRASPGWPSMATRETHASRPWSPVRRMRRTLATAIISQTGS